MVRDFLISSTVRCKSNNCLLIVEGRGRLDDSDSEHDQNEQNAISIDEHIIGRKRPSAAIVLNPKPFPGVGRYQPIGFLTFLLLGAPAGEKCWHRFALDAHLEAAPPRPRLTVSSRPGRLLSEAEDITLDDFMSPRDRSKRTMKPKDQMEDENEAIRIFNAETTARAQRLEELKLALSLFPDDESIKAELKQFVDTQRRTSLASHTGLSHSETLSYASALAAIPHSLY